MTALVLPDVCQLMNQPDFVGDADFSEIVRAVFAWEIYISIWSDSGIRVGQEGDAAIYFNAVLKSIPSAKTCFAIRTSFSVSLRQLEKIIF